MSKKLTESTILECQAKFNLDYHISYAYICQQLIGFEGKDVLEIGGSLPQEFVLNYLNAKSWSAIESPDYEMALKEVGGLSHQGTVIPHISPSEQNMGFNNRKLGNYNFFLGNVEDIPEQYYNKFDLIFSIAAFEHINKFPLALEKMFHTLKPGGQLFSMFSPIWSSHDGHHLPQIIDQQGKTFNFGNSPIPPWGHLLMRPADLCKYLYDFTDKITANLIGYYVYNSPHINRFFTEDYIAFFKQSLFKINKLELTFFSKEINPEIQLNLEKTYPGRTNFSNNGILTVLEKEPKEPLVNLSLNYYVINTESSKKNKWQLKTPVCLIIFNRPKTTQKVFEVIRQVKPSKLLVVADGARANRPEEAEKCAATRAIINQVDWECEVLTNYSDINLGCKKRVVSGLNWVFDQVEEAIILEDDCLPHPTFFRFCEELLERYRHDPKIMVISGNNFQLGRKWIPDSYYFSIYNHCWGWASWRRAWELYDIDMKMWPKVRESNQLFALLQNPQAVGLWSNIFQHSHEGFDTWDFAWTFACWTHNGLSIIPSVNLVSNIGFGPEATHAQEISPLANLPIQEMSFPLRHPPVVTRNTQADDFTDQFMFSGTLKPAQAPNQDRVIEQAVEYLNAQENQQALSLLETALTHQPAQVRLNYGKAIALARLGRQPEAIASLHHLLAAVPTHRKGQQLLAELGTALGQQVQHQLQQAANLLNEGKKVEALRRVEAAVALGVFVPGMHYLQAVCLGAVGRYEEALQAAKQELAHNPSHVEAQTQVEALTRALIKPKPAKIPTAERAWGTTLPRELMMSIQNATHNYSYQGVPLLKNPFDFALYPLLIWQVKPLTIIEIGSKSGGSALWFGDLLNNFGIEGRIYSIDIVQVTQVSHPRVTFMEGDGQALHNTLCAEWMRSLPRPLLVIEDADHSYETSKSVLEFFHPYLEPGEYMIIEDGIISDIVQDAAYNRGPHQALKAFLAEHQDEYEIDGDYCDFFGYNVTWATNGFLKKLLSD